MKRTLGKTPDLSDKNAIKLKNLKDFTTLPPDVKVKPKGDSKIYFKKVKIESHEGSNKWVGICNSEGELMGKLFNIYIENAANLVENNEHPYQGGYAKTFLVITFEDGKTMNLRVDVGHKDFNPYMYITLGDYINKFLDENEDIEYVFKFRGNFSNNRLYKEPNYKVEPKKEETSKYKFEGSNYDPNLSVKDITKIIKEQILKKYPNIKVSVTNRDYKSIIVTIKDFGFNPFKESFAKVSGSKTSDTFYSENEESVFVSKVKSIIKEIESLMESYNFDNSDSQSDYFHVNFYKTVTIDNEQLFVSYLPQSVEGKQYLKYIEADKQAKERKKENKKGNNILFAYGDIILHTFRVRAIDKSVKEVTAPCIITKAPNGEARYSSYNFRSLKETTLENAKELEKKDLERNKGNSRRNKFISVVYLDGNPYTIGPYTFEGIYADRITPYDGEWTHAQKKVEKQKPEPKTKVDSTPKAPVKAQASNKISVVKSDLPNGKLLIEVLGTSAKDSQEVRAFLKKNFIYNAKEQKWLTKYGDNLLYQKAIAFLMSNEPLPAQTPKEPQVKKVDESERLSEVASKFEKAAESNQKKANAIFDRIANKLTNTNKRMQEYNSARNEALYFESIAKFQKGIANNLKGKEPYLDFLKIQPKSGNYSENPLYIFCEYLGNQYSSSKGEPIYVFRSKGSSGEGLLKSSGFGSFSELDKFYKKLIEVSGYTKRDPKQVELEELLEKVKFGKIEGFFPTPNLLIDEMIKEAKITSKDLVLEPSAGIGSMADRIFEKTGIKADTVELNYTLAKILQLKGYPVYNEDFLSFNRKQYDKILMNPPFESGQDADHITHAFSLLKPNGILVAVCSEGLFFRSDKKSTLFREFVKQNGKASGKLENMFSGKDSFRQTGIAVRVVVLQKGNDQKVNINLIKAKAIAMRMKAIALTI